MYDLVIIGGGTAGLVCAAGAAGLGARVALIEKSRLGGDCLWTGCVPSKALLHAAREGMSFAGAMAYVRASRDAIAPNDSPERFRSLGVDVIFGHASFSGPRSIAVNASSASTVSNLSNELRFRKAVIATGSRPVVPRIDGLDRVTVFTSDTIFEITEQPASLTILGGGPVGCELAQAFARLGTRVTLIEASPRLLPREDPMAAAILAGSLARDGVAIETGRPLDRVTVGAPILVATGREPVVDGLDLARAGIHVDAEGIRVDRRLRTTNPRVYAAGDVASRYKFTHAADALARIVVRNALFFGRGDAGQLVIPWCTYTSPEVAQVGVTRAEAEQRGAETITIPLTAVDRAVVDGEDEGFVALHHERGRVIGATIVASRAGDLIATVAFVMQTRGTLEQLASAVFPYPTLSTSLRQAGDAYQRTKLTPGARRLLRYYFRLWSPGS